MAYKLLELLRPLGVWGPRFTYSLNEQAADGQLVFAEIILTAGHVKLGARSGNVILLKMTAK